MSEELAAIAREAARRAKAARGPDEIMDALTPGIQERIDRGGMPAPRPYADTALTRGMGQVNSGIANFFDAIGGPANTGINWALREGGGALGYNDMPQLDTAPTRGLMEATGVPVSSAPPKGIGQRALHGMGNAAGALVPLGLLGRAAGVASNVAGQVGSAMSPAWQIVQKLTAPFGSSPAIATGAELAAGAGGGAGGEVAARDAPPGYQDLARLGGELAGGFGAGMAVAAAPAQRFGGAVKQAVTPFLTTTARQIAGRTLRQAAADPERAAGRLEGEYLADLTPAQKTGEPGIMAAERAAMERDPALAERVTEQTDAARRALETEARGVGGDVPVDATVRFVEQRRAEALQSVEAHVARAKEQADAAVARLGPQASPETNSALLQRTLEQAQSAAKAEEARRWGAIPQDTPVGTDNARAALREITEELGMPSQGSVAAFAREFLGEGGGRAFGDEETARNMLSLYSELRQDARRAIGQQVPDNQRASVSNRLAQAVWLDLTADVGVPEAARNSFIAAREYTRQMHEVFDREAVSAGLSRDRAGQPRVAPGELLDRTVSQGGAASGIAIDDMRAAARFGAGEAGESAVNMRIEDYLRQRLLDRGTTGTGEFSPAAAGTFAKGARERLDRFPTLAEQLADAQMASRRATRTEGRADEIARAIASPRQSQTAAFVSAAPGSEVKVAVFGQRDPVQAYEALARTAAKDPTGEAAAGLRRGVTDHVVSGAFSGETLRGDKLAEALRSGTKTRAVLERALDPEAIRRLERIAEEARRIDAWEGSGTAGIVPPDANPILAAIIKGQAVTAASKHFSGAGLGGSLRMAGMAAGIADNFLGRISGDTSKRLIRDAIEDENLMRALLLEPGAGTADLQRAQATLTEWLAATGGLGFAAQQADGIGPREDIARRLIGP